MTERNPLLLNLVPLEVTPKVDTDKVGFADAMEALEIHSVFDIIRQPKDQFAKNVSRLSDVNGELAYDNAMCYAVQIARLYREEQVSSGNTPSSNQRTGVRALVDVGPSYPNLFKENWDDFCKVGAIAAVDSPVAYLNTLYRLATTQLEDADTGDQAKKILLDVRRPDLKSLVIDRQTTFTPLPMLTIVNDVLSKSIEEHLASTRDVTPPTHQVFGETRHPFFFPYNYSHHQCTLGLSGKKPELGELNYRISPQLPISQSSNNDYGRRVNGADEAQYLLSGLGAAQQQLLIEPSLFSTYCLSRSDLRENFQNAWRSSDARSFTPLQDVVFGYLLPIQESIKSTTPDASTLDGSQTSRSTRVELQFTHPPLNEDITLTFQMSSYFDNGVWEDNVNSKVWTSHPSCRILGIYYQASDNGGLPLPIKSGYRATFHTIATATRAFDQAVRNQRGILKRTFTLSLDDGDAYALTPEEQAFFLAAYGVRFSSAATNLLPNLKFFLKQTGLNADNVESLLGQRGYAPVLSPNCPSFNILHTGYEEIAPFPYPSHYGSSYINGVGANEPGTREYNRANNSIGLIEQGEPGNKSWFLTNTSLNRFDRLQRMIRLQRWLDIPFNELDTLIVAPMRAEGDANLGMELNSNTLRVLGVFRYFKKRYGIMPEEFAAFLHHLSPFATADQVPLFDQVFNNPSLFDSPLVLDTTAFDLESTTPEDQKILYQLCAGLKVEATQTSLLRMAAQTKEYVGPLKRSVTIVSSLYRQARIASMFGLSAEEGLDLAALLGGDRYLELLTTGGLRSADAQSTETDILDVLMQMDWAVTWLKESKQTVSAVRRQLGSDEHEPLPIQDLTQRLHQVAIDAKPTLVNAQQLMLLNLPADIDWMATLAPLFEGTPGLLKSFPLTLTDDVQAQIAADLGPIIDALGVPDSDKETVKNKLGELLLAAYDRQQKVIDTFLQDLVDVPKTQACLVVHWAKESVPALLQDVLSVAEGAEFSDDLLARFQRLLRHAQTTLSLGVSAAALRLFLVHPKWLGSPDDTADMSLASLYLLGRYNHLFDTLGKPETELLGYFVLANTPELASNLQTRTIAEQANSALAQLLDWDKNEIRELCNALSVSLATTLAHVEWLARCQDVSQSSGLAAHALLQASALDSDSELPEWQAVGNAVMAASR